MHTLVLSLPILLFTIINLAEVRPLSKLKQGLIRRRREHQTDLLPYPQTTTVSNHPMIGDIWNDIQPVLNDHLNSHLSGSSKPGCTRTTNDKHVVNNGDYVEYCLEKLRNPDGQSYSTKTKATLYRADGAIIPLHQAESNIEIETYNPLH